GKKKSFFSDRHNISRQENLYEESFHGRRFSLNCGGHLQWQALEAVVPLLTS
ncbi:hypothetical protein L9F63_027006, partial [Diploptera punctata]